MYGYDKTLIKRELKGARKEHVSKKSIADELVGGGDE